VLFEDTDPAVERRLLDLLRAAPPWQRLRLASQLSNSTRTLYTAGLRRRHPGATAGEWERLRLEAWYGRDVAALVPTDHTARPTR
jgi:hypothetical protein